MLTEIATPAGFNIDVEVYEITVESGQAYQLEITNTPKSPIYIQKVDDKGNPLMGAQFRVTTMNGAMVGTVTTGHTGYAIIPYAEPGWYVIEETTQPYNSVDLRGGSSHSVSIEDLKNSVKIVSGDEKGFKTNLKKC